MHDSFWLQGMLAGHKAVYDCIQGILRNGLYRGYEEVRLSHIDLHGDDDQIVPIRAAAMQSSRLVKGAILKVYRVRHMVCARH